MRIPRYQFWPIGMWLNSLRCFGFLLPEPRSRALQVGVLAYNVFLLLFINIYYIIVQTGELCHVWGDVPLMVNIMVFLLTNFAFLSSTLTVLARRPDMLQIILEGERDLEAEDRPEGRHIIDRCCRFYGLQLILYYVFGLVTIIGWVASAEPGTLPTRAWYPYDENKSPAYEITYTHQGIALILIAVINISMDSMITCLMAVTRCRLQLLHLSLTTLCSGLPFKHTFTPTQDAVIYKRLCACIAQHQRTLHAARGVQRCFAEPILVQFSVSVVIICITAYDLFMAVNSERRDFGYIVPMVAYLLAIVYGVYIYCNEGNSLYYESMEVSQGAYSCSWQACSARVRRGLLVLMMRAQEPVAISVGGLVTLSLACFTAMIKASYTFFTVLQQVEIT